MTKTSKSSLSRRQLVGIIVLIAVTATLVITMALCRRQSVQVQVMQNTVEVAYADSVATDSVTAKELTRRHLRKRLKKASKQKNGPVARKPRARNYDLEPDKE